METVMIQFNPIKSWYLNLMGRVLLLGKTPYHSLLLYSKDGLCWAIELTNNPPNTDYEVWGRGDGYIIRRYPVLSKDMVGLTLDNISVSDLEAYAKQYASTDSGYAWDSDDRDWYPTPQGYGGPEYEPHSTCNTYVSWVLRQCHIPLPQAPDGTIGWGSSPMFPGPKKDC